MTAYEIWYYTERNVERSFRRKGQSPTLDPLTLTRARAELLLLLLF